MIASLNGLLLHKDAEGALIECQGVGYGVAMSLNGLAALASVGGEVRVLVHTHLTQDSLRLYGFVESFERDTFLVLINTTGIGPKLALAILSAIAPLELATAVAQADKARLTRIPGVGAKKAERLIVDLKDRLPKIFAAESLPRQSSLRGDLLSALENLGFNPQVAEKAAKEALKAHPEEVELTALVRAALRTTTH